MSHPRHFGSRAALAAIALALLFAGLLAPGAPSALAADPVVVAPCEGDECQGPAPAPDDPTPATATVEGPPNPPVRFPKANEPKKAGKKQGKRNRNKKSAQRRRGQR